VKWLASTCRGRVERSESLSIRVKALTIRQPWASLIIAGEKDVENRTWRTSYRGPLVIHAGSAVDREGMGQYGEWLEAYPQGVVLGTVDLVDIVEDSMSWWALDGQWHWLLAHSKPRRRPRRVNGRQGLWNYGR
jgi:ASCH domain